jgi:hypothetical protein
LRSSAQFWAIRSADPPSTDRRSPWDPRQNKAPMLWYGDEPVFMVDIELEKPNNYAEDVISYVRLAMRARRIAAF